MSIAAEAVERPLKILVYFGLLSNLGFQSKCHTLGSGQILISHSLGAGMSEIKVPSMVKFCKGSVPSL